MRVGSDDFEYFSHGLGQMLSPESVFIDADTIQAGLKHWMFVSRAGNPDRVGPVDGVMGPKTADALAFYLSREIDTPISWDTVDDGSGDYIFFDSDGSVIVLGREGFEFTAVAAEDEPSAADLARELEQHATRWLDDPGFQDKVDARNRGTKAMFMLLGLGAVAGAVILLARNKRQSPAMAALERLGGLGVTDEQYLAAEEEFQGAAVMFDRELGARFVDCSDLSEYLRAMHLAWRASGRDSHMGMQLRMRERRFDTTCRHERPRATAGFGRLGLAEKEHLEEVEFQTDILEDALKRAKASLGRGVCRMDDAEAIVSALSKAVAHRDAIKSTKHSMDARSLIRPVASDARAVLIEFEKRCMAK